MSTYIYDSRRVFWPANAPAKSIPISIQSSGAISKATNVQDAIQMLTNDISATIGQLPNELDKDGSTVRDVISCVNQLIEALKNLRSENAINAVGGNS